MDITPKAQETKEKIDKLYFIKTKNFCLSKETVNRMKRQATKWEKIFKIHLSDKGLMSRTYKEKLQLNNNKKKTNHPIKKWIKNLNNCFSEKDIQMATSA